MQPTTTRLFIPPVGANSSSDGSSFIISSEEEQIVSYRISDEAFLELSDAQKLEVYHFCLRKNIDTKKELENSNRESERVKKVYQKALQKNTVALNVGNTNLQNTNQIRADEITSNSKWSLAWKVFCVVGTIIGATVTILGLFL